MVVTSHMPEAALFLVPARQVEASPPAAKDTSNPEDRLATVDALLATYRDQQSAAASLRRELDAERETFVDEAHHALEYIAKPALWAIAQRLLTDGGGGMVVEQAAESKRGQRLTLWMSLEGQVASPPRVDRYPYLRIDVDVPGRVLTVWEGDMWNGRGASRSAQPFTLETLTTDEVERRAIGIIRRVVVHDATPLEFDS